MGARRSLAGGFGRLLVVLLLLIRATPPRLNCRRPPLTSPHANPPPKPSAPHHPPPPPTKGTRKADLLGKVLATLPPRMHKWMLGRFPEPGAWLAARLGFTRTAAAWSMVGGWGMGGGGRGEGWAIGAVWGLGKKAGAWGSHAPRRPDYGGGQRTPTPPQSPNPLPPKPLNPNPKPPPPYPPHPPPLPGWPRAGAG